MDIKNLKIIVEQKSEFMFCITVCQQYIAGKDDIIPHQLKTYDNWEPIEISYEVAHDMDQAVINAERHVRNKYYDYTMGETETRDLSWVHPELKISEENACHDGSEE